ncbi:MAG TPA: M48 family metallopeptidase [Acidobacteriota bacterium]|nr:M48 family metallopeptidase [Acidobacteriota bacterium]
MTRVGQRIASAVGRDLPSAQWEFVVFDSPEVNAFALPGGKVGVYTGLLNLAASDDELAVVIGHEIAHVTARHGAERMTWEQGIQMVGGVVGATAESKLSPQSSNLVKLVYGAGTQLAAVLPHSRFQESEADKIGLRYAAKAGYDPRAALTFWAKMNQQSDAPAGPALLRTHPTSEDRIAKLEAEMPAVLPLFEASRRGGVIADPNRPIGVGP